LAAGRLARVPTVGHLHEAEQGDRSAVLRALLSPLQLADAVIVISRSTLEAMVAVVPQLEAKARLVYNGVPQPPTEPEPARRQPPIRLVVVGRLSPRKAPHLALEAAGQLVQQGYDVALEVVGSAFEGYEWYVKELEQRADQPDLRGRVTFTGYASPIWPVFARADIAVMPSLREPFGNAVVEAQLSRRPVVATAALGHTESIEHDVTGLLVEPEDVPAMAAAIARLIDHPDLAERIARDSRRVAIERFSVDRYRREIAEVVTGVSRLRQ
jgi:glycosyltransferase involved in cell wall biosynthesis